MDAAAAAVVGGGGGSFGREKEADKWQKVDCATYVRVHTEAATPAHEYCNLELPAISSLQQSDDSVRARARQGAKIVAPEVIYDRAATRWLKQQHQQQLQIREQHNTPLSFQIRAWKIFQEMLELTYAAAG